MRGATHDSCVTLPTTTISTHTPHAGRDMKKLNGDAAEIYISTHTPLARRDVNEEKSSQRIYISTHTPLARRDNKLGEIF